MPPKPQVFKTPDGKEFASRAEWRDYMMLTFYSFTGVKGSAPEPRLPGSIDGQMYNITDCADTELVVMDHCEQVQIDECKNTRIFIGACESSMFIRNCENCTFYIACRQLRLREVVNCKFFCFSTAEVHIEYSNGVQFAPFNGGYAEHANHLTAAKLPYLEHNLWYDIFDHNDPEKHGRNWSILPENQHGPAWFPAGTCEPAVPLTKPGSVKRVAGDTMGKGAPGAPPAEEAVASFAINTSATAAQAAVDAGAERMERMTVATKEISMEAALLIASAMGKGIDCEVWLSEGAEGTSTTADHFSTRFISLGLTVGIEEDWDTKRELEVATSQKSIATIQKHCCGSDSSLVDVTMFLNCAQQKVAQYMADLQAGDDDEEDEAVAAVTTSSSGSGGKRAASPRAETSTTSTARAVTGVHSGHNTIMSSVGDSVGDSETWEGDVEDVPEESLDENDGEGGDKAGAMPTAASGVRRIDTVFASPERPGDSATRALLPDSPYDEEVAFDLDEEEEADTADGYGRRRQARAKRGGGDSSGRGNASNLLTSPPPVAPSPSKEPVLSAKRSANAAPAAGKRSAVVSSPATGRPLAASATAAIGSPDAAAAPVGGSPVIKFSPVRGNPIKGGSFGRASKNTHEKPVSAAAATTTTAAAAAKKAAITRPVSAGVSKSTGALPLRSKSASALRQSAISMTSSQYPANVTDNVEARVRLVVQQTDLYHLVQVHLGFIDAYTLVPARGAMVISKPRPRLGVKELQNAFFQARTRFSEGQVLALMKLVARYARNTHAAAANNNNNNNNNDAGCADENAADNGANEFDEKEVVAVGQKLSSEWLKKYMVHLRLTKKSAAIANGATSDEVALLGSSLENFELAAKTSGSRDAPLPFQDWLGAKRVEDRKEASGRPKEWRKALAGQKNDLSRAEVDDFISSQVIIPDDMLKTEITLMTEAWALDIAGRKDFSHEWNVAVRRWCKETGQNYRQLAADAKKEAAATIRASLLKSHAAELRKCEKEKQTITRTLFRKYQKSLGGPMGAVVWGAWLEKHQETEAQHIARSKEDAEQRGALMAKRKARSQAVAPLVEIERKFNDAAETLSTFHGIELRKSLVGLRKRALAATRGDVSGDEVLVTKELFDACMARVLAPRVPELAPELRGLAQEARKSHEGLGTTAFSGGDGHFTSLVDSLFSKEQANAVAKAAEITAGITERAAGEFKMWKQTKKEEAEAAAAKQVAEQAAAEEAKKSRKKAADKAYKAWVKARKSGKYISRADHKAHALPETHRAVHDGRWSKDTEVALPEVTYL